MKNFLMFVITIISLSSLTLVGYMKTDEYKSGNGNKYIVAMSSFLNPIETNKNIELSDVDNSASSNDDVSYDKQADIEIQNPDLGNEIEESDTVPNDIDTAEDKDIVVIDGGYIVASMDILQILDVNKYKIGDNVLVLDKDNYNLYKTYFDMLDDNEINSSFYNSVIFNILKDSGDYDLAYFLANKIFNKWSDDIDANNILAWSGIEKLKTEKNNKLLLDKINKSISYVLDNDSTNPSVYLNRGDLNLLFDKKENAISDYEKSFELDNSGPIGSIAQERINKIKLNN